MIDQVAPDSVEELPGPADAGARSMVRVTREGDRLRIVLDGEVDIALQPDLTRACDEAGLGALPTEVDARGVTFMDSTGIAFLARLTTRCTGKPVLLPSPVVRWLIDLTGVSGLLDVVDPPAARPH